MVPASNPIEEYKNSKGGNPLRIEEDLPHFVRDGWETLTASGKELLKWLGVFFRKPTPGKFMMRIRMPNGFATSSQLACIAEISKRLGNSTLDITTRQQIELRGYTIENVPEIFEKLRGVNLTSLQTGQDNVRNIIGCPLAGLTSKELLDASPIVFALDQTIVGENGNPEFANLPRKLNIAVTGCVENCTHTESQDIALVPATKFIHGTLYMGFHILVGGKMGSGGFTIASNLGWFVEPDQAHDVVIQIIKLFRDEGPRGPRTKCRLAFLLEDWGLDRFRAGLANRLGWEPGPAGKDIRSEGHNDHFGIHRQKHPELYSVGLRVKVGRLSHDSLRELGRLAETYGNAAVRLTTSQNPILVNIPEERLDALLVEPLVRESFTGSSRFSRGLVACTGTDYCGLAQIDTKTRAMEVSAALEQHLGSDGKPLTIHWSGCPAGCGNHLAADIGLRGMKVNVDGRSVEAVAIYVGGKTGPAARAGTQIMDLVPCDEALPDVLASVGKHLSLFKQVQPRPAIRDRILMVPVDGADDSAEPDAATEETIASSKPFCAPVCDVSDLRTGIAYTTSIREKRVAVFLAIDGSIFAVDAEEPAGSAMPGEATPQFYPVLIKDNQVWVEIQT